MLDLPSHSEEFKHIRIARPGSKLFQYIHSELLRKTHQNTSLTQNCYKNMVPISTQCVQLSRAMPSVHKRCTYVLWAAYVYIHNMSGNSLWWLQCTLHCSLHHYSYHSLLCWLGTDSTYWYRFNRTHLHCLHWQSSLMTSLWNYYLKYVYSTQPRHLPACLG